MSLRTKLTAALVALAVVSVGIVGVWTVVDTGSRLRSEVSDSLDRAADELLGGERGPGERDGFPGGPGSPGGRPRDFDRILYQLVDGDGSVVRQGADQALPVSTADAAVAAADAVGVRERREMVLDGEPFEVLTVSLGRSGGALQVARSLDEAERVARATLVGTGLALLVVSVLATVAGWWVARQVTRPLVALAGSAESVARTGRLDVALPADRGAPTRDETRRLTRSFRSMLESLAAARAAQQQLVQDAGHELRTPLTSLRTNVALLRRTGELDPASRAAIVEDLDAETRELTDLVEELVVLAGEDATPEPVVEIDLAAVAEEVAARARRRSGRSVTVLADGAGGVGGADGAGTVLGRRGAVTRAVRNLVDNAMKFDESDGPIEVRVHGATVEVADRGPGVAAGELDRIFDRFHRTDEARSRPGSGLGLAIVAAVAADHRGRAEARRRDGGGLVVSISLDPGGPVNDGP